MKTFVVGDIHGSHKALVQALERCNFDRESDTLIVLGDVVDGWPESRQVIDELLGIPNLIHLLGNHDQWARDWMIYGHASWEWIPQGGQETVQSYGGHGVPESHKKYMRAALDYYVDGHNRLFVHAGMMPHTPMVEQFTDILLWDRSLWNMIRHMDPDHDNVTQFDRVFIGHTATTSIGSDQPFQGAEVWNLDTGCGWGGRLTIMDVDTEEYWQSDLSSDLHPGIRGRS